MSDVKASVFNRKKYKLNFLCLPFSNSSFSPRPIKSYWHGAGQVWGVSDHSSVSPPGSCDEWRSDSSLAVGLATRLGDPTQSVLAPHRWHHQLIVRCQLTHHYQGPLQQGAHSDLCGDTLLRGRTQGPQQAQEISWYWRRSGAVLLEWIQSHYVRSRQRYHPLRDSVSVWCSVDQSTGITCSQNIRNIKNKLLCRSFLSNLVQMLNFY